MLRFCLRHTPRIAQVRLLSLPGAVLALLVLIAAVKPAVAAPPPGYLLTWSEEFAGAINSVPNPSVWSYDTGGGGWGNNELETYVSDQAHAHIVVDSAATDGRALQMLATKAGNNSYYSARIKTAGKVSVQYGYIEARIRFPYGQGMWPAFWMLGNNIGSVGWPACGEMDIMEALGREPATNHGSMHLPGHYGSNSLTSLFTLTGGQHFKDAYHLFALQWGPNEATFFVDGIAYETHPSAEVTNWVFNAPFFFILNLAVGGDWPGPPDATTKFPQKMLVDYIRVYQYKVPLGKTISLQAIANAEYVSADNAGANPLIANRTTVAAWEQFVVVDAGNGNVALKALANNRYISADNGGVNALIADATTVGPAQTFQWIDGGNGTVHLKCLVNNQFVSADKNAANPPNLYASRPTASIWETFQYTVY